MKNLIVMATEGFKSVNAIIEEYMSSGAISQQQKWDLVEFWCRHSFTNEVVDYAIKVAEGSPSGLYTDSKQLLSEVEKLTALRDSNKARYMAIKFTGEGNPAWDSDTIGHFWKILDMDMFDYLVRKYHDIASAIILDITNYWKENNIEPLDY